MQTNLAAAVWALAALLLLAALAACEEAQTDGEHKLNLFDFGLDEDEDMDMDMEMDMDMDMEVDANEDEDLQMVDPKEMRGLLRGQPLRGAEAAASPEDGDETAPPESAQAPAANNAWREPHNELSLVRLFHGRYYEGQYAHINEVLVRELDSANLEANLAKVDEWLERERQRGVSLLNQATVEALEQLSALGHLNETSSCNRDAYTILFKNDRATKGRVHRTASSLAPPRRIDSIVYQLFMRHAIRCLHQYPEIYASIRSERLGQELVLALESFMDAIIGDPHAVSSAVKSIRGPAAATLAYNLIRVHGSQDADLRYLGKVVDERKGRMCVNGERIRDLVGRYLVAPCRTFVETLGPDVFVPARFDAQMFEREDRYAAESKTTALFMHGWLHYRLCELLIKRDELHLSRDLVEYVNRIFK